PQPAEWAELSVEAQTGVAGSTLELYRAALAARREHPGLGAGEAVTWLDAPDGVLALSREGFVCTTNTTGAPVRLPAPGALLLASAPVAVDDGFAVLPADATAWWTV
ncbi:DUF3459 domain-containing protein, partial [Streptomyces wuyuanensis]